MDTKEKLGVSPEPLFDRIPRGVSLSPHELRARYDGTTFNGDTTVLGQRLNAVIEATRQDWKLWKETESEHQGVDFRTWKTNYIREMAREAERLEVELSTSEAGETHSASAQRYHDYYVKLEREGMLSEEDKLNYERALQMERNGLVKRSEN